MSAVVRFSRTATRQAGLGLVLYLAAFLIWAGPLANGLCARDDSMLAHWAHRALVQSSGRIGHAHHVALQTHTAGPQTVPEAVLALAMPAPALTTAHNSSGLLVSALFHVAGPILDLRGLSPDVARCGTMSENLSPMPRVAPPDPPPRQEL